MKGKIIVLFLFMATAAFSQSFWLVSPNGGEEFTAGQKVTIRWTSKDPQISSVDLYYSIDNGMKWKQIGWAPDTGMTWIVPHLRRGTDRALLKITAWNIPNQPFDVSDGNFTIQASPPDMYEPNDDFSSACPILLGDSVVKNAFLFGEDSLETDSSFFDLDYYKITLESGKLVTISPIPWDTSCFKYGMSHFALYDDSKSLLCCERFQGCWEQNSRLINYVVTQTGTYYLRIWYGLPIKYGLSIHQSNIGSGTINLVSPNGGEEFTAGKATTIRWTQDTRYTKTEVIYSLDGGNGWNRLGSISSTSSDNSLSWTVPHLKHGTAQALVQVIAVATSNTLSPISDVSNGVFTIQASPPDDYESNNDFASAYPIAVGDSAVKNAIVMANTYSSTDTSNTDIDFFKVTFSAGKTMTISVLSWCRESGNCSSSGTEYPFIMLYDASHQELCRNDPSHSFSLSYTALQSGDYYVKVEMRSKGWYNYGLSISQDSYTMTLDSPNGGETYSAEQQVSIRWTHDREIYSFAQLHYSIDNGTSWWLIGAAPPETTHCTWTVPHLKQRTDLALVKVSAIDFPGLSDVSNGTFTIQASPPDDYESNNDFASAYPIAVGDSVVKNAIVIASTDSLTDTSNTDIDFFKVTLSAGKLTTFSTIPSSIVDGDGSSIFRSPPPIVQLYNAAGQEVPGVWGRASLTYCNIMQSGVYYCKIAPANGGLWSKFLLSIKSSTIISTQNSALDTASIQKIVDSSGVAYKAQLTADTTKLNIHLTLDKKIQGSITTTVLAPDELAFAFDTKAKVKAISVAADAAFSSSIKTADISIPYSVSELNGNSQASLTVFWLNDSTNQWTPVMNTVDSVKHQIVAHTTHFSIYGVFVKSHTAIGSPGAKLAPAYGIKANFLRQKQSVAVHFTLPKAVIAELALYNIQGKCIKRSHSSIGLGSSTLLWNLGALSNGKYFISVKAENCYSKEAILIMN